MDYDHATTHMQRLANCVTGMAALTAEVIHLGEQQSAQVPLVKKILYWIENVGEASIALNIDVRDMVVEALQRRMVVEIQSAASPLSDTPPQAAE